MVDLIEGFRQAGLEFVLTRHEASAAFMADAMASASGVPGVCVATLGPGATNLVTGIAQAYLDRSPMLAFTGQLPADRYEITTHQKLELRALFAPITKWQARLAPATAGAIVDRALRVALAPRRGPVYLETPSDVPRQEAAPGGAVPPPQPPAAAIDEGAIDRAAALVRASARPVLIAGTDALDERAAGALRRLAEGWTIPVLVSPKGKGAFREDHPLFLGTLEGLGTGRLYDFVDGRDLVVLVGLDPVELDREWTAPAPLVHLGPLPNDDRYYASAVELVGPVGEALERLLAAVGATPARDAKAIRAFRDEFRSFVAPRRSGLTPQEVVAELRAALPEAAIVTCDVGSNKAVTAQCWPAFRPRTFFMSNGLSSMGYGLPAALGLKLLQRNTPVACVLGDGGFAMTMAELETAARMDLPVTVVVLADDALSQIKAAQERKGFPVTGTTFGGFDYAAIARGFGATGLEVRTAAECRAAFRDALGAKTVTLVAARIDPSAYRLE